MTSAVQEIVVYVLFALAVGYFLYRFYTKKLKRKAGGQTENCKSGGCGCG